MGCCLCVRTHRTRTTFLCSCGCLCFAYACARVDNQHPYVNTTKTHTHTNAYTLMPSVKSHARIHSIPKTTTAIATSKAYTMHTIKYRAPNGCAEEKPVMMVLAAVAVCVYSRCSQHVSVCVCKRERDDGGDDCYSN